MIMYFTKTRSMRSVLSDDTGISMTEGVIVIPFFIIVWMGLIFLHLIYIHRLEAQVEAHNIAYQGAMVGNCDGRGASKDDKGSDESVDNSINGANTQGGELDATDLTTKATEGGDSMFDWSHHIISAKVSVDGLPELLGGPTKDVKGRSRLLCNMKPRSGLADAIYGFIKDKF